MKLFQGGSVVADVERVVVREVRERKMSPVVGDTLVLVVSARVEKVMGDEVELGPFVVREVVRAERD